MSTPSRQFFQRKAPVILPVNVEIVPTISSLPHPIPKSSLDIILDSLYDRKIGSDVTFIDSDGTRHEFHRDIISQHSSVIKAMLKSDEKKIEVSFEYDGTVLHTVRKHIYTKSIGDMKAVDGWNVWRFSHQYDCKSLQDYMHVCLMSNVPTLKIETLQQLITAMEGSTVNKPLKDATIIAFAKYVDTLQDIRPCLLQESKVVKCCKCVNIEDYRVKYLPCAKESCCEHRTIPKESKKRAFDAFALGFGTFKPDTQQEILRIKYNISP